MKKVRLSVSIDGDVAKAARKAVQRGEAENISALVNGALRARLEHLRKLEALGKAIAAYEKEHGVISDGEMEEATRRMKERAIVVRGGKIYRPAAPAARKQKTS